MNVESPNKSFLADTEHFLESPSFLPADMIKRSGKSRPDYSSFKRSHTTNNILTTSTNLKRPLQLSPKFDSPTCTLAADLGQNFHIDRARDHSIPTPKRYLFSERPALNNITNTSSSSLSSRHGSTNSIFSFTSSVSSVSSIDDIDKVKVPYRKVLKRSHTTSVRSLSSINFKPIHSLKESDSDEDDDNELDMLCIPSPVVEKDTSLDEEDSNNSIGSPLQQRLRKYDRRTHSMIQNPKDMYKSLSNEIFGLNFNDPPFIRAGNSILNKTGIKTFMVQDDLIPRIEASELVRIMNKEIGGEFDAYVVVDCRFEYEFQGGHIDGAINVSSQRELERVFLEPEQDDKRRLVVFHCEFSSYRGPLMANHLRNSDRTLSERNHPNLRYPDVVILQGGYKHFFELHSELCFPKKYVEMNDSNHIDKCEMELENLRKDFKLNNNLKRAMSLNTGISIHQMITNATTTTTTNTNMTRGKFMFDKGNFDSLFENTSSPQRTKGKPQQGFKFPLPRAKSKRFDTPIDNRKLGDQNRFKFPKC